MREDFFDNYNKNTKANKPFGGAKLNVPVGVTSTYKGDIGIEIELEAKNYLPTDGHLENVTSPKSKTGWASIRDGSLRGNSMEYILRQPCFVEEVSYLVDGLYKTINDHKTVLDISNRCSTHVHINMTGQRVNTLTSIMALWGVFEPFIIEWCGEERKTNHFCLSFKDSLSVINGWSTYLKTGSRKHFTRNLKYSAFNYLPLWDKGSIEFRCGRASDNSKFVTDFATFLYHFVTYVKNTYKDPSRIAHDLSERGGHYILQEICKDIPETFNEIFAAYGKSQGSFNDDSIFNFRVVQGLCLGFNWHEWLPLISEEYIPDPFTQTIRRVRLDRARVGEDIDFENLVRTQELIEEVQNTINFGVVNEARG